MTLNISSDACRDPQLPVLLPRSGLPLERIVLELTGRPEVPEYAPLAPLARRAAHRCAYPETPR